MLLREPAGVAPVRNTTESHARSLAKAVSWRALGTVTTAALVFVMTGRMRIALGVGAIECASKIVLFFVHERLWNMIKLGRGGGS